MRGAGGRPSSRQQAALLAARRDGDSVIDAAADAGVSPGQARGILRRPEFTPELVAALYTHHDLRVRGLLDAYEQAQARAVDPDAWKNVPGPAAARALVELRAGIDHDLAAAAELQAAAQEDSARQGGPTLAQIQSQIYDRILAVGVEPEKARAATASLLQEYGDPQQIPVLEVSGE